jgi:pyruvate dehydrogenase E2 component (dihydrolipoamide acetyltransferase)
MPNLGFDSQTARLIEWLKAPGDPVVKGEVVAIIESDKADVDLEALASGVLLEQLAQAGQEVSVGAVIGRIGSADEYRPTVLASATPLPEPGAAPRISPVAQRIANERQIALKGVVGSGGRGRIMRRDLEPNVLPVSRNDEDDVDSILALPRVRREAYQRGIDLRAVRAAGYPNPITLHALAAFEQTVMPATQPGEGNVSVVPLSRMRQTIGKRLSESMREAPHFYVTGEFIFDDALARLKDMPVKLRITDLIVYLVTQTLARVPRLNATMGDGVINLYHSVHLALAVQIAEGLLTPVLHDAGRYSLESMGVALRDLIERTRSSQLSADELRGGTFTISNMGMVREVDHFTAVINPPQVAILAVGALKPRPVVIGNGLFIRQTAHLTLSGDHRAVDGMDLARFMTMFGEELEGFGSRR